MHWFNETNDVPLSLSFFLSLNVHVILYLKRILILKLWSRESSKIWKLTVAKFYSQFNFITRNLIDVRLMQFWLIFRQREERINFKKYKSYIGYKLRIYFKIDIENSIKLFPFKIYQTINALPIIIILVPSCIYKIHVWVSRYVVAVIN